MKYASSILMGGTLLEASNCGFGDYKRLQLLCPICKEPVFLQSSSTRTLNQKEVLVSSHFKHFPKMQKELIAQCEYRVSSITQVDVDKSKSTARNQRLKIFQSSFWNLFLRVASSSGHCPDCIDSMQKEIDLFLKHRELRLLLDRFANKTAAENFYQSCILNQDLNSFLDDREKIKSLLGEEIKFYFLDPCSLSWQKHKQAFSRHSNVDYQFQILQEIIDFLCVKSSRQLLLNCVVFGVVAAATSDSDYVFSWFYNYLIGGSQKDDLWKVGLSSFCMDLIKIDWAKALLHIDDLNITSHFVNYNSEEYGFSDHIYNGDDGEWYSFYWIGEESAIDDITTLDKALSNISETATRDIPDPWDDEYFEYIYEERGEEDNYIQKRLTSYKDKCQRFLNFIKKSCLMSGYCSGEDFIIVHMSLYHEFFPETSNQIEPALVNI